MNLLRGLFKDQKIGRETTVDSILKAGRFDSMDRTEIVVYLEEVYKADCWGTDLRTFDTIQDIIEFAQASVK